MFNLNFSFRLSSASGDILSDVALVTNLEEMKQICSDVAKMIEAAVIAKEEINNAREEYRRFAALGSILYFVISDLFKINMIYQFSLKLFMTVFKETIVNFRDTYTPAEDDSPESRKDMLYETIISEAFINTSVGLFERDKLTFFCHSTIQVCYFSIIKLSISTIIRYSIVTFS